MLHMSRGVASKQDSWGMMEDVFNTIDHISRTEDRNKIYSEPNFESVPQMTEERVQEVSLGKYPGQNPTNKTYSGPSHRHNTILVLGTGVVAVAVANPIGTTVAISLTEAKGR